MLWKNLRSKTFRLPQFVGRDASVVEDQLCAALLANDNKGVGGVHVGWLVQQVKVVIVLKNMIRQDTYFDPGELW
jgi:hypothetical protein